MKSSPLIRSSRGMAVARAVTFPLGLLSLCARTWRWTGSPTAWRGWRSSPSTPCASSPTTATARESPPRTWRSPRFRMVSGDGGALGWAGCVCWLQSSDFFFCHRILEEAAMTRGGYWMCRTEIRFSTCQQWYPLSWCSSSRVIGSVHYSYV